MLPQTRFPVEVIARILSYVLASPTDDPQKLPTARPHPVSVLLVSKEITRLLLPHFYRSINVFKPMDWYTLFNSEYGVLGLDEGATPEDERRFPPLAIRSSWVHELFLGITAENEVVSLPLDVQAGSTAPVDWEDAVDDEDNLVYATLAIWLTQFGLLPDDCKPNLSNLNTLVLVALPRPGLRLGIQPVLDNYNHQLLAQEAASATAGADLMGDVSDTAAWIEAYMLGKLGLFRQIPTIHLPADHTFLVEGWLSPLEAVYKVAPKAELFAYLDLDGLPVCPLRSSSGSIRTAFNVFGYLLRSPHGRSAYNKNIVLVGTVDGVRRLIVPEQEDLARSLKEWEWLAPDGTRAHPADALGCVEDDEDEMEGRGKGKNFVEKTGADCEEATVD